LKRSFRYCPQRVLETEFFFLFIFIYISDIIFQKKKVQKKKGRKKRKEKKRKETSMTAVELSTRCKRFAEEEEEEDDVDEEEDKDVEDEDDVTLLIMFLNQLILALFGPELRAVRKKSQVDKITNQKSKMEKKGKV